MSWQDRDWAQEPPPIPRARRYTGSIRPVGNYGIVNILIAINVGLYVVAGLNVQLAQLIYGVGVLQPMAVMQGQVWRLITAQYLHANMFHLLLNMIALHFLGRPLERRWSARRFFWIYTACGVSGNIFYVLLGLRGVIDPRMVAVGASGCIYGLLGIVAVLFPYATVYVWFLFPIRLRTAAIVFGAIAFLSVIERGQNYGGEACHLAGLAFGVWWAMKGEEWWDNSEWILSRRRRGP